MTTELAMFFLKGTAHTVDVKTLILIQCVLQKSGNNGVKNF